MSRERICAQNNGPLAMEVDLQCTTLPLPPASKSEETCFWCSSSKETRRTPCDGLSSSSISRSTSTAWCRRKSPTRRVGGSSPPSIA
uniref:Uncharacterized protein n=1 Tax=Triticum urartu TaxID=4572 RepID=A0A8R7JVK6_TRIUA